MQTFKFSLSQLFFLDSMMVTLKITMFQLYQFTVTLLFIAGAR